MDDLYYDPWDVEIDLDPYPTYRRLRDESRSITTSGTTSGASAATPTSTQHS